MVSARMNDSRFARNENNERSSLSTSIHYSDTNCLGGIGGLDSVHSCFADANGDVL